MVATVTQWAIINSDSCVKWLCKLTRAAAIHSPSLSVSPCCCHWPPQHTCCHVYTGNTEGRCRNGCLTSLYRDCMCVHPTASVTKENVHNTPTSGSPSLVVWSSANDVSKCFVIRHYHQLTTMPFRSDSFSMLINNNAEAVIILLIYPTKWWMAFQKMIHSIQKILSQCHRCLLICCFSSP